AAGRRRTLAGRPAGRLRSGVEARGPGRPERRRALVEMALALRGVLDDLLEDRGPRLPDGLDALDLGLVAAQVGIADDDRRIAAHRVVDDGLDRGLRVHPIVVVEDRIAGETLLGDQL